MSTSRLQIAAKSLEAISADLKANEAQVGNEMKMKIALRLKCTTRTIETYMAGEGKKLPFAKDLRAEVKKELGNDFITAPVEVTADTAELNS